MSSESPSFAEETASNMLKELQSWWEVPSIAQYISLFREAFNLPEIEIEELENGLIEDTIKGPNEWLQNLVFSFLKSIMYGRVNSNNWETQLKKLINRKWRESPYAEKENPFVEDKSFHELSLRSKVEIIYCFCLYRLDNNDTSELMKSMDAEALRVQKLGFDDSGNTYWYFYGTRLYKEEAIEEKKTWDEEWKDQKRKSLTKKRGRGRPPKKQSEEKNVEDNSKEDDKFMNVSGKSRWSVVCDTLEEWVNFAEKFKNSKSKNEKSLFQIIQENFLPTLNKIYEEKERKLQQKIKELLPAREKIVTRRETRRLRGDTGGDINYALLNGYDSDEDYRRRHTEQDEYRTHVVKDRAQRLEERNKRASEAESVQYIPSRKRAKHNEENQESSDSSTSHENSESGEVDVMSQMIKLLTSIKLHKDAWPFLYAVDEEDAPGYYEIIKDPVDLSLIESRLYKGEYETVGDLDEDFSKMVTNCELYNGENHAYSKMAQTLRVLFRKEVANVLEALESVESSNSNSEESNDSQYHSSSSSSSSSPPHETSAVEPKEHKKVKGKKKKKKHNMEALDLLAQASDIAVQNSNSNDMLCISNLYDEQKRSSDFPNLKILPIHSHPPSLIEKYSSNSPKESLKETNGNSEVLSPSSNARMDTEGQYLSASPTDSGISSSSETTNYMNNLTHFTSFIEKDSDKNLNVLSNSDVTSVLQESDSNNHNSANAPSFVKVTSSSGNLHSIDNVLDGYHENLISQFMKYPIYNTNYQVVPSSKSSYEENFPKQDMNLNRNRERSPNFVGGTTVPDNSADLTYDPGSSSDNITTVDASVLGISPDSWAKRPRISSDLGKDFVRPENVPADATQKEVHLKNSHSAKSKQTPPPNEINQQNPSSSDHAVNVPVTSYQHLNLGYINPSKCLPTTFVQNHATYSNCSLPLHFSSPYSNIAQQQDKIQMPSPISTASDSSNLLNSEPTVCLPIPSYPPLNFGLNNSSNSVPMTYNQTHTMNSALHHSAAYSKIAQQQAKVQKSVNNSIPEPSNPISEQTFTSYPPLNLNFANSNSLVPTTFIPTFAGNSNSSLPLHIPASYPKAVEHQTLKSSNNSSVSHPNNNLILQPEVSKGSAVTYHVYSQSKPNQNSVQNHISYMNSGSAVPNPPTADKRVNQDNFSNSPSPPQKTSPVPQETRPAPYHVPSTNMPSMAASSSILSTNKSPVPVTISSFINSVTSSPQTSMKTKPVIVRAKASNTDKRSPIIENIAPTSLNTVSNTFSNNPMQQTNMNQSFNSKTVPVVLPRPSLNQSDLRFQNNPVPAVTMQSNVCLPNGLPVMQQIVYPSGTSNSGQYVFASPPNTIRILSKEQTVQLQNSVGQLNQGFLKVVPQIIAPTMQVSKDAMQTLQFQTLSPNNTQAYTQVAQTPQYVSVPYVVSNQNSITNSSPQTAMNFTSFQLSPRQMQINGQGNG